MMNTNNVCPFRAVGCEYAATCEADRVEHEAITTTGHLSMLRHAFEESKRREDFKDKTINDLREEMVQLNCRVHASETQITDLYAKMQKMQEMGVVPENAAETAASPKPDEVKDLEFHWTVENFGSKKQDAAWGKSKRVDSPYFYSHRRGYGMKVELYPNGFSRAKGNHVSLYIRLVPGQYDGELKWPYSWKHQAYIIHPSGEEAKDETRRPINPTFDGDDTCWQLPTGEGNKAQGWPNFLAHDRLEEFLKDDKLHVKVKILDKTMP